MNIPKSFSRRLFFATQLFLLVLVAITIAQAQSGSVDLSFNPFLADSVGEVKESIVQPDGKILIRGNFEAVNGKVLPFIARLNADGSLDTSFNPPTLNKSPTSSSVDFNNFPVQKIVLQSDGKILVAGRFSVNGNTRALIRLNSDGSPDSVFNNQPDVVSIDYINGLDVYSDDRFVASAWDGGFKTILLSANGTIISSAASPSNNNGTGQLALQPDGRILAFFSNSYFTRLNQNLIEDLSFSPLVSGSIFDFASQADGKILLGGSFNTIFGFVIKKVARLNQDGSLDTGFNTTNTIDPNGDVHAVEPLPDGKILIGGNFTQINGVTAFRVARLNSDGGRDTTFNATSGLPRSFPVVDLDLLPSGKILATGNSVYRLNSDGSRDNSFNTPLLGKPGEGKDFAVQADGKIIVVGQFTNANGVPVDRIVRFNTDGTVDTSFNPQIMANSGTAHSIAIQSDGKIIVGFQGRAFRYNPDGSTDFVWSSTGFIVNLIEIAPDGKIYFGSNAVALRSYNPNGTVAVPQFSNNEGVTDVVVQPDSKVVFSVISPSDSKVRRGLPNGGLDPAFNFPVNAVNNYVFSLALQPDGKILIGGDFTAVYFDTTKKYLARLNADGSLDASFSPIVVDKVRNIAVQPDGKILVQTLTETPTETFSRVFRYNSDGSQDLSFQAVLTDKNVRELGVHNNGSAIIVGDFTRVNGIPKLGIARLLNAPSPTEFDFDGDGRADISVFRPSIGAWYVLYSGGGYLGYQWGLGSDKLAPADYDGDGKTDLAVWRPNGLGDPNFSYFFILQSSTNTYSFQQFGISTDVPVPGDWDGDGKADVAVYRAGATAGAESYFYYRPSSQPSVPWIAIALGVNGDKPVVGDFDGDGKQDAAVFRPSNANWLIKYSSNGQIVTQHFGLSTDIPVPADYDGDGKTNIAVYRPSNGTWYTSTDPATNYGAVRFGTETDIPVPADYDGDGRADVAVYRPSNGAWYLLRSSEGFTGVQFGISEDKPIPNAFVP